VILMIWSFLFLIVSKAKERICICTGVHTNWERCLFKFNCTEEDCVNCSGASSDLVAPPASPVLDVELFNGVNDDVGFVYNDAALLQCEQKCHFVARSQKKNVDARIFSLIYLELAHLPREKRTDELWIAHGGESRASYYGRHMRNSDFMNRFDIHATTEATAHLHVKVCGVGCTMRGR
jgi:hypothetical protein